MNQNGTTGTANGIPDIWDTIDDYNGGDQAVPPGIVANWNTLGVSNTDCYSIDIASTGDSNVWVDATMATNGTKSSCASTPSNCTMMDKITKLSWTKLKGPTDWAAAWNACFNSPYNGQTGWRLPTQKEMLEAYVHGIRSAATTTTGTWHSIDNFNSPYWTGSTSSQAPSNAWTVKLASGESSSLLKTSVSAASYACVRSE
jgi:hypothetical protein